MRVILMAFSFVVFSVGIRNSAVAIESDTTYTKYSDSTEPSHIQKWATIGLAAGSMHKDDYMGIMGGYDVQLHHHLFTIRFIGGKSGYEDYYEMERFFETGLLYGYGVNNSLWYANISAGLAYISMARNIFSSSSGGTTSSKVKIGEEKLKGIGLPWQGRIFSKFSDSSNAGMGITLCGNVNQFGSFWALLLTIEFEGF